jgi:hypothetical protein
MLMTDLGRKEELERRLAQSRRLLKEADDPITKQRIGLLIGDLEQQRQQEPEKPPRLAS